MHTDKACTDSIWPSKSARVGAAALVFFLLLASRSAAAAPHPWPFDFDAQLADDPAALQSGLDDLGQGLPGLPDDEMSEVTLGTVKLYVFTELADALSRARDSGPASMPQVARPPVLCAAHESFTYPSILKSLPSISCLSTNQSLASELGGGAGVCTEVEYPETYVFDHPAGQVDVDTVNNFEGLIAVSGEALRHLDYPVGLIAPDFFTRLRPIIAKIRYATLSQQISARLSDYASAQQELSSSSSCFDPAGRAALESTVNQLIAELNQAQQELDQLYQDGLAQAGADRDAAKAQCRSRDELPYPALTDEERIALSFYIGGIFWRARGAGLLAYPPDPGQGLLRRILYVRYPFQAIADMAGGAGGAGIGTSILIDENWGWDEWWDMGTTPGSADKYSDLVGMTKRGKRSVDLARPQIEGRGYDISSLLAGALQMGPCYYYAWDQLFSFRLGEALQDPYMWFIEWPTSIGEFCTGAALAEGLTRTLLWGTPIPPDQCNVEDCPDGDCGDAGSGSGGGDEPGADAGLGDEECNALGECMSSTGSSMTQGCACTTEGSGRSEPLWILSFVLAFWLLQRRRRQRS